MGKKEQIRHAIDRGKERHKTFSLWHHKEAVRCIRGAYNSVFLKKKTSKIKYFAVKIDDEWYPVLYDKGVGTVTTVLPKKALNGYRDLLY